MPDSFFLRNLARKETEIKNFYVNQKNSFTNSTLTMLDLELFGYFVLIRILINRNYQNINLDEVTKGI